MQSRIEQLNKFMGVLVCRNLNYVTQRWQYVWADTWQCLQYHQDCILRYGWKNLLRGAFPYNLSQAALDELVGLIFEKGHHYVRFVEEFGLIKGRRI